MIEDIHIENLGIIVEADISLAPGLTAITGETGAGKTMLLTGLGLILGGKADNSVVRNGAETAVAESRLVPPPGHPALEIAEDAGAILDDGALLVVRTVAAAGRSRAHLGGRSVPQGILGKVAAELVTVHGQSDQIRLRSAAHQRAALDEFAGSAHAGHLADLADAHARLEAVRAELRRWEAESEQRELEILALQRAMERIGDADPEPGEQQRLREESERLGNVEALRIASGTAAELLTGDIETGLDGINAALETARAALADVRNYDPDLGAWADQLAGAGYVINDVAMELSSYSSGLEADPQRLEQVHARRALLAELTRDYAGAELLANPEADPDAAVVDYAAAAATRLADLTQPGLGKDRLLAEEAELRAERDAAATKVTAGRTKAAAALEKAVAAELDELAMGGAKLYVNLAPVETTATGAETVEFDLLANRGGVRRPLARGASGGELSRVMLAIEVALAHEHHSFLPTFVFDEVDAGVGGQAAVAVGRRLAELARRTQVIVVTHLAQVAAFADAHVVVTKTTTGGADAVTNSNISVVDGDERLEEIARMLAGDATSTTALAHAAELLSGAFVQR